MAKTRGRKRRLTDTQVKKEVKERLAEIERLREQAREQGLAFSGLDAETLERKIRGQTTNTPYIYSMSWTSGTSTGSTASFTAHVSNPDATSYYPVFATIFFGLGNHFNQISRAWIGRDKRWPEVSSDRTSLGSGASVSFPFSYTTPTVPLGTYLGNVVVWVGERHDQGDYFDRGLFDVKLS